MTSRTNIISIKDVSINHNSLNIFVSEQFQYNANIISIFKRDVQQLKN